MSWVALQVLWWFGHPSLCATRASCIWYWGLLVIILVNHCQWTTGILTIHYPRLALEGKHIDVSRKWNAAARHGSVLCRGGKKKNNSTNSGTHQRFRVRVHARKERCFDENALAGLFMGLGKSVEDSTNLPLAPCDWLKFATGCNTL